MSSKFQMLLQVASKSFVRGRHRKRADCREGPAMKTEKLEADVRLPVTNYNTITRIDSSSTFVLFPANPLELS
jgi:hypothetical protein